MRVAVNIWKLQELLEIFQMTGNGNDNDDENGDDEGSHGKSSLTMYFFLF